MANETKNTDKTKSSEQSELLKTVSVSENETALLEEMVEFKKNYAMQASQLEQAHKKIAKLEKQIESHTTAPNVERIFSADEVVIEVRKRHIAGDRRVALLAE